MADPTNLDLWQLVSEGGSANLDLGATPDAGTIHYGVIEAKGEHNSSVVLFIRVDVNLGIDMVSPAGVGVNEASLILPSEVDAESPDSHGSLVARAVVMGAINCTGSPALKAPIQAGYLVTALVDSYEENDYLFTCTSEVDLNVFRGPSGVPDTTWTKGGWLNGHGTLAADRLSSGWALSAQHYEAKRHLHEAAALAPATLIHHEGALPQAYFHNRVRYEEAGQLSHRQFIYNNELADGDKVYLYEHGELLSDSHDRGWLFYAKTPRLHVEHKERFEQMVRLFELTIRDVLGEGAQLWYENKSWYEEAGYPARGRTPPTPKPLPPKPWVPPTNLDLHVLDDGTNNLEFYHGDFYEDCLTVYPQKVYVVMNEVRLFIVGTNEELPLLNMSLNIDRDAWAWGYKVNIPYDSLPLLKPVAGQVLELDLHINGTVFRVLAEKVGTTKTFERRTLEVSGRGLSAYLSKPYAAQQTFSSAMGLTAQQLMNNALTWNGQPIGWEIDWGITDWYVPEGVWTVQGTYMDAVKSIADSVGAMILPHPNQKKLLIRPKYPITPWNWGSAVPNYQVPDHVVQQEGVEWVENPAYNAVYVTGQSQGVLGYVKRLGTAGNVQAPMVVDQLITDIAAARMRGEAVLSTAGLLAEVTVSLPVLPETGIIMPGKMFQYVEGGEQKMGVTTGVSITQRNGSPVLRQEVGVTLHG